MRVAPDTAYVHTGVMFDDPSKPEKPPITWASLTRGGKIAVVAFMSICVGAIIYSGIASGSDSPASPSPARTTGDAAPSLGYAEVICERAVSKQAPAASGFKSDSTSSGQTVYVTGTAQNGLSTISYGCVAEGESDDLTLTSVDVRD